jgi:hypothetical protein
MCCLMPKHYSIMCGIKHMPNLQGSIMIIKLKSFTSPLVAIAMGTQVLQCSSPAEQKQSVEYKQLYHEFQSCAVLKLIQTIQKKDLAPKESQRAFEKIKKLKQLDQRVENILNLHRFSRALSTKRSLETLDSDTPSYSDDEIQPLEHLHDQIQEALYYNKPIQDFMESDPLSSVQLKIDTIEKTGLLASLQHSVNQAFFADPINEALIRSFSTVLPFVIKHYKCSGISAVNSAANDHAFQVLKRLDVRVQSKLSEMQSTSESLRCDFVQVSLNPTSQEDEASEEQQKKQNQELTELLPSVALQSDDVEESESEKEYYEFSSHHLSSSAPDLTQLSPRTEMLPTQLTQRSTSVPEHISWLRFLTNRK